VYRSDRRTAQARRTRRRILDAAALTFLERGYAGATMRTIAAAAGVAVPTVELAFGTKARLLKAAIDVAIAGDDEPVPVLERAWVDTARKARTAAEFLAVAAEVITAAQSRSAGLVLAVFEGARTDAELAALATQLVEQRAATTRWLVDALAAVTPPHAEADDAADSADDDLWLLMDPAIYERLVRHRGWTPQRYERWFARSAHALLYPGRTP
jgi:AcrR family transcriptional regulator